MGRIDPTVFGVHAADECLFLLPSRPEVRMTERRVLSRNTVLVAATLFHVALGGLFAGCDLTGILR